MAPSEPTRRQWLARAAGITVGGIVVDAATRSKKAAAQTTTFVDTTSNQTIGGVKTFTSPPVVPAGAFPEAAVAGLAVDLAAKAPASGPFAPTSLGASAPTRYVGGTASGAPTAGTFAVGDFVIDQTGKIWICTVAGTPGTWAQQVGVDLTSAQTVGGVKSFTSPPVVPPGAFPEAAVAGLVTDLAAKAPAAGPFAPTSPGASAPTRYVGGTSSGAPTTGTFAVGDFVIDQTGKVWICTVGGTPGTWVQQSGSGVDLTTDQTVGGIKTFTAPPVVPADAFPEAAVSGLVADLAAKAPAAGPFGPTSLGASAATRYVGGTASGAPTTGTFAVGDFVIDQTGKLWINTVAGTPGTWVQQAGSGVDLTTAQSIGGVKTFTSPPVVPADAFPEAAVAGLVSDLAAKAPAAGPFAPTSPGASAPTRYVGGTASGAPTTGTFAVGDFVIDQTAKVWICTVAGTPGTWVQQAGVEAGVNLTSDQTIGGVKTFTSAPALPGGFTITQLERAGTPANTPVWSFQPSDIRKGPFGIQMWGARFGSTWDNVMAVGYNVGAGGSQALANEPMFRFNIEQDYWDGVRHVLEAYFEWVPRSGLFSDTRRPLFWQFDRDTGAITNFAITGDSISFQRWKDGTEWASIGPGSFTFAAVPGTSTSVALKTPSGRGSAIVMQHDAQSALVISTMASSQVALSVGSSGELLYLFQGQGLAINAYDNSASFIVQNRFGARLSRFRGGPAGQVDDLAVFEDRSLTKLSRINKNGYFMTAKTTAPVDSELTPGEVTFWLDATNGAAKFMIKAKQNDGTIRSASIPLT